MSKWFQGLRLKFMFILGIGSAAITTLFLVAFFNFQNLSKTISQSTQQDTPSALSLGALNSGLATLTVRLYEAVTTEDKKSRSESILEAKEELEGVESELAEFKKYDMSPEEEKEFNVLLETWSRFKLEAQNVVEYIEKDDDKNALELLRGEFTKDLDKMDPVFTKLDEIQTASADSMEKESKAQVESATFMLGLIGLVSFSMLITVGLITVVSVIRSLTSVVTALTDSSTQVSSAAQQIAASSQELSQSTTEQASSLEETSSAVEELNSMVQKNAESAQQSLMNSQASGQSAVRGKQVVEDMKRAIADIDTSNQNIMNCTSESNVKFGEIIKVISEIGNKTKVINEIVFQTKLLSFNASVEAARAGEHGKGFAVVAEEVGNLAQMSGNAAKEISSMLDSSIKKVEEIVTESRMSVEKLILESKVKVELGTRVAVDCSQVLDEIVKNVNLVTQMSHAISTASDEQARGISEITKAVGQLDQTTQQNAAASEETSNSAESLSDQAQSMQNVVQVLVQAIEGNHGQGQSMNQTYSKPSVLRSVSQSKTASQSKMTIKLGSQKSKTLSQSGQPNAELRMAAGGDVIPGEDDPRFKDI